jgi:hypothetical protein
MPPGHQRPAVGRHLPRRGQQRGGDLVLLVRSLQEVNVAVAVDGVQPVGSSPVMVGLGKPFLDQLYARCVRSARRGRHLRDHLTFGDPSRNGLYHQPHASL